MRSRVNKDESGCHLQGGGGGGADRDGGRKAEKGQQILKQKLKLNKASKFAVHSISQSIS